MAKRAKRVDTLNLPDGWGINACSLCEKWGCTLGQQRHGGVRYCCDCIKETLAWFQMKPEERTHLMARWAAMEASPEYQAALPAIAELNGPAGAEAKKAHAIGEARFRVYEAWREEST